MKTARAGRSRLRTITPVLVVADLQRSVDFYLQKIGFTDPAIHGEPPCFAMMNRDGIDLMLSLAGPESTGRANGPDGTWDVHLCVADLDAEIAALRAAGVTIDKGPTETVYDMREIEILDPDGHRLCLAEDTSRAPESAGEVWEGMLDLGTAQLRLILRLVSTASGGLVGTLDSPDQRALNLPIDTVQREGSTLRFEMKGIDSRYEGTMAGDQLNGEWTQRGRTWPLTLRKG